MEDAKALLMHFVEQYLGGIHIEGMQSGFGVLPDQFLFAGPALNMPGHPLHGKHTTLAVPTTIMLLRRDEALQLIQDKLNAAKRSMDAVRPVGGRNEGLFDDEQARPVLGAGRMGSC